MVKAAARFVGVPGGRLYAVEEGSGSPLVLLHAGIVERLEEVGDPDAVADLDVRLWVDGVGQPASRVPGELRDWIRTMDRDLNSAGRVGGRPIRLGPPAAARLGTLRMPVLAIAGALDVSDVWATARHLELTCPDARAVLVADAAHMIAVEQPDVVAGLVAPFIRRLGAFA